MNRSECSCCLFSSTHCIEIWTRLLSTCFFLEGSILVFISSLHVLICTYFFFFSFFLNRLHSVICIFLQQFLFFSHLSAPHMQDKNRTMWCTQASFNSVIVLILANALTSEWMPLLSCDAGTGASNIAIYQQRENLLCLSCSSKNTCKAKTWKLQ